VSEGPAYFSVEFPFSLTETIEISNIRVTDEQKSFCPRPLFPSGHFGSFLTFGRFLAKRRSARFSHLDILPDAIQELQRKIVSDFARYSRDIQLGFHRGVRLVGVLRPDFYAPVNNSFTLTFVAVKSFVGKSSKFRTLLTPRAIG